MSGEDLRICVETHDDLCQEVRLTVLVDGVEQSHALWADERRGEALVASKRDGWVYVIDGTEEIATELLRGHVEIHGPTDEQRREHLRREREGGA